MSPPPAQSAPRAGRLMVVLAGLGLVAIYALWSIVTGPRYSFHPMCTYRVIYRLEATIAAGGKDYSDSVVFQHTLPRGWISSIFSNSCKPSYGTALTFRTDGGQVVLMPTRLCIYAYEEFVGGYDGNRTPATSEYRRAMRREVSVDVMSKCRGINSPPQWKDQRPTDAYVIASADRPQLWEAVQLDQPSKLLGTSITLKRAVATALYAEPRDSLEERAPALLESRFSYQGTTWDHSPEPLIDYWRRKARGFAHDVAWLGQ